jgi:hypothetical protein
MYVSASIFVDPKDGAYATLSPARPIAAGSAVVAVPERVSVHVEGVSFVLPVDKARALALEMLRACDESAAAAAQSLVAPADSGAELGGQG